MSMNKEIGVLFVIVLYLCFILTGCGETGYLTNERLELQKEFTEAMQESLNKGAELQLELDSEEADSLMQNAENEAKDNLDNSIQGTIMSGDFSCLEDTDWERMQEIYEREIDLYEWHQLDLNSDGIEDLILQEKRTADEDSNQHRILGIFGCEKDEARCVLWDDVYMGNFSFCGPTGELMHRYYSFGGMVDTEGFEHYYYDKDWNKIIDYQLVIWEVNSPEGYDYPTKWFEAHPDMQEEGIYYRRYEGAYTGEDTEGEVLTLEELKEIYETEMGMEMYSSDYIR